MGCAVTLRMCVAARVRGACVVARVRCGAYGVCGSGLARWRWSVRRVRRAKNEYGTEMLTPLPAAKGLAESPCTRLCTKATYQQPRASTT